MQKDEETIIDLMQISDCCCYILKPQNFTIKRICVVAETSRSKNTPGSEV